MMSEILRKNPAEKVAKGKGALDMNFNLKMQNIAKDVEHHDALSTFIKYN